MGGSGTERGMHVLLGVLSTVLDRKQKTMPGASLVSRTQEGHRGPECVRVFVKYHCMLYVYVAMSYCAVCVCEELKGGGDS